MHAVLQELQNEKDASSFKALKEQVDEQTRTEIVLRRCGHSKEQATQKTPVLIKRLKPPVDKVILCWQANLDAFEGYYPRPGASEDKKRGKRVKQRWSASRSYGPGLRSQLDALWQIVQFLWWHHKKQRGDSQPAAFIGGTCVCFVFLLFISDNLIASAPAGFAVQRRV